MRKVFYSLILFACFFFNITFINAEEVSTAKCVYDRYTVLIDDSKLKVDVKLNSGESYESKLSINNFMDSDGNLTCLNQIYIGSNCSGRTCKYTLTINKQFDLQGGTKLEQEQSYVNNVEPADVLLKCSYGENKILYTKTTKKVMYSNTIDDTSKVMDYDTIGDECPTQVYGRCTNYNGKNICTISFESSTGLTPYYLDGYFPDADEINKHLRLKELYQALRNPMEALSPEILDYKLLLDGNEIKLRNLTPTETVCELEECKNNAEYYAKQALRNIAQYCSNVYSEVDNINAMRAQDCRQFFSFYQQLVTNKKIDDYAEGCGFISTDLNEKLQFVLNLIQIIGPIAAIFLGMLDFIKAVIAGDPDKESKTAFKRLTTRLIAAALLFIIPLILGFLMDLFLGNDENYGKEDPFCDLVKWEE